jgi:hypothetical protein
MDDTISENDSMLDLHIDAASADYIESAGWWAKFSSVVIGILLFLILGILVYLYYIGRGYAFRMNLPSAGSRDSFIWLAIVLVFGFCVLMIGLLVNFALKVRNGVEQPNHDQLERGFNSLKIYFIIYGVLCMLGAIGTILSLVK